MRAVLDVNVVISAILAPQGTPRQVLTAREARRFISVTSEGIIAQIEGKLRDPRIGGAYAVTPDDIFGVTTLLRTQSELVVVSPN